jgi:hypothetical protein
MFVVIGSHVVPLEGKVLPIALVIARITLNMITEILLKMALNTIKQTNKQ